MAEGLVKVNDDNFQAEVDGYEGVVLVDMSAEWCPPCKMVEPVVEELAAEFAGKVKIGKLNVDQNPATRSRFEITAAPTFILFRNGKVLKRAIGAHSKNQLIKMLNEAIVSTKTIKPIVAVTTNVVREQTLRPVSEEV